MKEDRIQVVKILKRYRHGFAATKEVYGNSGFPGGKTEPGETFRECAIREAYEEGWVIEDTEKTPFFVADLEVSGKKYTVNFVRGLGNIYTIKDYKEKYRGIRPIVCTIKDINSWDKTFRNGEALSAFLEDKKKKVK